MSREAKCMILRKENLILTYACGNIFKQKSFWIFVNSIAKTDGVDLVILSHDIDLESKTKIENLGFFVVDIKRVLAPLFRDRHLCFYEYLKENGRKYKHVLISDCRDVLLQSNPFDWIDLWKNRYDKIKGNRDFLNHFVVLTSEGFKRSKSGFACIEHFEFQKDVPSHHKKENNDRWVCNAGVVIGTSLAVQNYEMLIFMSSMKSLGNCTDQGALNYLLHILENDETYQISFPQHDTLCLTGEGVRTGDVVPVFSDGKVCNQKGEVYYLVHQWDRLSTEIVQEIENIWSVDIL